MREACTEKNGSSLCRMNRPILAGYYPTPARHGGLGLISFFLAVLILLVFCAPVRAELVDRVAAVVNNDIIKLSELNKRMEIQQMRVESAGMSAPEERAWLYQKREEELETLIAEKLLVQEAQRVGITISDQEVDNYIEMIKRESMATEEQLRSQLEADGETMESFREQKKLEILRHQVLEYQVKRAIVITSDEVARHYEENQSEYELRNKYHLHHLALSAPLDMDAGQRAQARQIMDNAQKELEEGATLESVTAKYQYQGVTAADLGLFQLDELTPGLRQSVSKLQAKQVSDIVDTPGGFQMVWVEEIQQGEAIALENARADIEKLLYQQKLEERYLNWINKLREQSYIKVIR